MPLQFSLLILVRLSKIKGEEMMRETGDSFEVVSRTLYDWEAFCCKVREALPVASK